MADERDFELLDDYLTHRMSEQDRSAFGQKLQADPDLQHEYALQQRMIQGIKDARSAELKSMLNKVAAPANGPANTLAFKIILGTVASLILAAGAYWYVDRGDLKTQEPQVLSEEQAPVEKPDEIEVEPEIKPEGVQTPVPVPVQPKVEQEKNQTSAGTEQSKPSLAKRPDPLQAPAGKSEEEPAFSSNTESGNSTLIVETNGENARYTFHYQFTGGKLILFGPFEQDQYAIREFSAAGKRTVFMYHNDRYYLLEDSDDRIRQLNPVTDPDLLEKLKDYHNSK